MNSRQNRRRMSRVILILICAATGLWGCAASQVQVSDLPVKGAVYHVQRPDRSSWTYLDVVVGEDFPGQMPGDVDSITVTGPSGPLPLDRDDFTYNLQAGDLWAALPGPPQVGSYRFKVRSGRSIGTAEDVQSSLRSIPIPDTGSLRPARGETLTCRKPSFSWAAAEEGGALYYLIEIMDAEGRTVYRTDYVRDMLSLRLPPDVLEAGQDYLWRVRVADASDWVKVNNRSQTPWLRFRVDPVQGGCQYVYRVPAGTDDGWETSSLNAEGIDAERITEMVREILNGKYDDIHSVLLVRNGKLVLEEYFDGNARNLKHVWASVTKSIASILVGIAVDRGMIPDTDLMIHELFPEYRGTKWIDGKYGITLKNILTMTSGLDWLAMTSEIPLTDPRNDDSGAYRSRDPVRYTFDKDLVDTPGSLFNYSTGLSIILGEIIRKRSGSSVQDFSRKYLFDPLEMGDDQSRTWKVFPGGIVDTGGGILIRPRDMARIGYMMMRNGKWKDRRIVSEDWVRESTRQHIPQVGVNYTIAPGYGYQWHTGERKFRGRAVKAIIAAGHGGQYIFILPDLDLVAVLNSKHPESEGLFSGQWILNRFVVPSAVPLVPSGKKTGMAPESIDQYLGEYACENWPETILLSREGDGILLRESGGGEGRLLPEAGDIFHINTNSFGDLQIAFSRDDEGDVDGLVGMVGFLGLRFKKTR